MQPLALCHTHAAPLQCSGFNWAQKPAVTPHNDAGRGQAVLRTKARNFATDRKDRTSQIGFVTTDGVRECCPSPSVNQ